MEMVSIQTQRRIHEFEPQHVSNTLWACARMQLQEPLMLRAAWDDLFTGDAMVLQAAFGTYNKQQ